MVLPVVTTATGAFLVVIVFGMADGIRAQSASLGHADEIGRAVMLIAVTVLLVGVVEVAVATTRTVAHRTRELGVLSANGIPRKPVIAALLVEPMVAAVLGAVAGAVLAAITGIALGAPRSGGHRRLDDGPPPAGPPSPSRSASSPPLATSIIPTWNAASRPPIRSLTTGG